MAELIMMPQRTSNRRRVLGTAKCAAITGLCSWWRRWPGCSIASTSSFSILPVASDGRVAGEYRQQYDRLRLLRHGNLSCRLGYWGTHLWCLGRSNWSSQDDGVVYPSIYSACTGLSALSQSFWDFRRYRFLTGLGVGGVFAMGVSTRGRDRAKFFFHAPGRWGCCRPYQPWAMFRRRPSDIHFPLMESGEHSTAVRGDGCLLLARCRLRWQ